MTCCDPLGRSISSFRQGYHIQATDIDVALLYWVMSIGVYGIMIGGWASNNKFSLIGAVRRFSNDLVQGSHGPFIDSLIDDDRNLKFTRNLSATVWNELECFLPTIIVPDIFNLCVQKPIELLLI
jgi:hypothetical protein